MRNLILIVAVLFASVAQAELRFTHLRTTTYPDCFPNLQRGPLREDTYVWKHVNGHNLRAYVTYPPTSSARQRLGIAFFHGGGWSQGNPTYWLAPSHYLAARGMVTVSFQYRLASTHHSTIADASDDARDAIKWMREHATVLNINPDKVLAAGDSAGGHLALLATLDGDAYAGASFYPVLVSINAMQPGDTPLHVLSRDNAKPLLIVQGSADVHPATPPVVANGFCSAAAIYKSCKHVNVVGAGHAFLNQTNNYVTGITELDRWISTVLPRDWSSSAKSYAGIPFWVRNSAKHCRSEENYSNWSKVYGYTTGQKGLW